MKVTIEIDIDLQAMIEASRFISGGEDLDRWKVAVSETVEEFVQDVKGTFDDHPFVKGCKAAMSEHEEGKRPPITFNQFADALQGAGVVDESAVYDPEGYDGERTLNAIGKAFDELFPETTTTTATEEQEDGS